MGFNFNKMTLGGENNGGATLDTFTQMGGYVSDDVLTINEDSGVYYVQFN